MATFAAIAAQFLLSLPGAAGVPDSLLVEERYFGSFEGAYRIISDTRGNIAVLDRTVNLISIFSPRFELLRETGGYGWSSVSFDHPTAVASDGLSFFVSDYGNHRISRFDQQFSPISTLSTRDTVFGPARFGFPEGVAITRQGELYVLDGENLQVVKFDSRSNFETAFGGYESGEGRLAKPIEITVSHSDRVLVLEPNRIVAFDFVGNYLGSFGEGILSSARGFGEVNNGMVVVSADTIWTFDAAGNLRKTMAASDLLSEPLNDLFDAVAIGDRMFFLTRRAVGVFRFE
ncbi:MAG TPA: NHL repeat-containing protein [Bacteroidota bacterium]